MKNGIYAELERVYAFKLLETQFNPFTYTLTIIHAKISLS